MSIVFSNNNGCFVSHLDFLHKTYANINGIETIESNSLGRNANTRSLKNVLDMFEVQSPFLKDEQFAKLKTEAQNPDCVQLSNQRKRKKYTILSANQTNPEVLEIKNLFAQLLKDMMAHQSASQHLESSPSVLLNYFSNSFPLTSNLIFTSTLSPPPLNSVPFPFPSISLAPDNNRTARRLCSHVYNLIQGYFDLEEEKGRGKVDALFEMIPFEDKNDTDRVVVKNVRNPNTGVTASFVLPPHCKFYNWDVRHIGLKANQLGRFDLLLLDPPWSNKFIRRKKRQKSNNSSSWYNTMSDVLELNQIPIAKLLKPRALVAVWCTNNKSHIDQLVDSIFPAWGLRCVATWYWIKVTKYYDPVLEFSPSIHAKQPYERLIFGVPMSTPIKAHTQNSTYGKSDHTGNSIENSDAQKSNEITVHTKKVNQPDRTENSIENSDAQKSNEITVHTKKVNQPDRTENSNKASFSIDENSILDENFKDENSAHAMSVSSPSNFSAANSNATNSTPANDSNSMNDLEQRGTADMENSCEHPDQDGLVNEVSFLPEDGKIIVSVPSAVHSHKPPLADILAPYLPSGPACLELFARTLTPGWTALGNQVLGLQFEELYQ